MAKASVRCMSVRHVLPFSVIALSLSACFPGGGLLPGPEPEAGIIILDSGLPPPPDGGDDGGTDGGSDGGPVGDAGLSYDGGVPEVGVRCGVTLAPCAVDVPCCVAITGFDPEITTVGVCATPDENDVALCPQIPPIPPFSIGCDDAAVDCADGEQCCFRALIETASFVIDINTTCRPAGACTDDVEAPVCVNGADCSEGLTCCAATIEGLTLPIDFGVCRASCEISLPDGGVVVDAG
jgi:hypothetical protein